MTASAPASAATPGDACAPLTRRAAAAVRRHAATLAVLATLAWWSTRFVEGTGGREPRVLSTGLAFLLVATLLVRPWRRLPVPALLLGSGLGLAAVVVVLTAPTGLAGRHEAASYVFAGQLGVVLLAWATDHVRRTLLLLTLLAAGGLQFAHGWLPWWGLQDQGRLFQGTFYWHNQAGIFLAAGALVGYVVVMANRRPLVPLAWIVAPLCTAGVVYTTSRGSQLGLALGLVLLAAVAVAVPQRRRTAPRLVLAVGLGWAATTLMTRPPFFREEASAFAATAARSESFTSNGVQRFEDWRRAVAIFTEWPFTGAGFYSFDSATLQVTEKRDGVTTAFAHNGFLQAAADGGLVLLVPLCLAVAAVLLLGLRARAASVRAGDVVQPGAWVVFLVLVLHSGMDFDWTYPALLSLPALLVPLVLPRGDAPTASVATRARSRLLLGLVSVALLVLAAVGAWDGGLSLNVELPA
ncbi:MAG: O-antigen ligase family protein [Actinomycetes bacterium]